LARPSTPVPAISVPALYKTGFGFTLGGAPRTPEERERLRSERRAFFRRGREYRRKNLPRIRLFAASATMSRSQYNCEYVGRHTSFHRVILAPALLAPPATNYNCHVLAPDVFSLVPEIREHAPFDWDEWRPTHRPEHDPLVDASMLFVPPTTSSGRLSPKDMKLYFPNKWRKARTSHANSRGDTRIGKKQRRLSKGPRGGGSRARRRL
jgi:hypothetical protein